jgi:hypothetical protein
MRNPIEALYIHSYQQYSRTWHNNPAKQAHTYNLYTQDNYPSSDGPALKEHMQSCMIQKHFFFRNFAKF